MVEIVAIICIVLIYKYVTSKKDDNGTKES